MKKYRISIVLFILLCLGAAVFYGIKSIPVVKMQSTIAMADRISVYSKPGTGALLYTSTNPKDIEEFSQALDASVEASLFEYPCACTGSPAIYFYRGDEELLEITNHHGFSIGTSFWAENMVIKDLEEWLRWFDNRDIKGPRMEVEDTAAQRSKDKDDYTRWQAAMPKSIRPLWTNSLIFDTHPDLKPLVDALTKEFPDPRQRALALYEWYGSGAGQWSSFPGYEIIPSDLLELMEMDVLIATAMDDNLNSLQLEGMARFFCFQDRARKLPDSLRQKLLAHSNASKDQDNVARGQKAFGKQENN